MNVTVTGMADNEDVDYFVVAGQEGRADLGRSRGAAGWGSPSSTPASPS